MTLAQALCTRSNALRSELQPYQPHRPSPSTSKEPREKRSPGQLVVMETGPSNQPWMYAVRFGRFRFVLHSRELLAGGMPLSIGNRALDVLIALIEARGELVTKDELLNRVWPNTTVEENNLQFQISALRKVLGEDRDLIRTVSGRGYRFIAEVTAEWRNNAGLDEQSVTTNQARNLPDPGNPPMTAASRLATLAGAGSTGKMRMAIELARRTLPAVANDASGAQFERVSGSGTVSTVIAPASGIDGASISLERMATPLDSRCLLLLLGSCEHIIETVTSVAEALVQANAELDRRHG
jgi:non-specific serine/threonine protein kinase